MQGKSDRIFSNLNTLYNRVSLTSLFVNHDWFHYAIFFLFLFLILFLSIKIEVAYDGRNWRTMKCKPKYVFFSGFLKNDGNNTAIEETIKNYADCTTQSANKVVQALHGDQILDEQNKKSFMMKNRNILKSVKEMNLSDTKEDEENLIQDISLDLGLTTDSAAYYTYLKNLGLYVDQMDSVFNYINEYFKGYLSYLFIHFQKNNNDAGMKQVRYLLDTHYDGINIG